MRPIHLQSNQHEQQLSATALTPAAEAGYFDRRQHQLPRDWPSPITRFLDSGPSRHPAPKPSAGSRPTPRTPPHSAA